jgi:ParB/RepB/Spo0J family partition protein
MRFEMDDEKLAELIDDIRRNGVLSRLWVIDYGLKCSAAAAEGLPGVEPENPFAQVLYEVRAGHRRLIACQHLLLTPVPCTLYTPADSAYAGLMAIENLIREEPSSFEEGHLFARIAETPGITEDELRRRCAKSLAYIYDRIALVKGDPEIALAVHRKLISFGVAKKLNQIRYPAPGQQGDKFTGEALQNAIASADAYRAMFLERAVTGGCTIAVAESWVAQWRQSAGIVVQSGQPAIEPMPAAGYPLPQVTCALCGEPDEPHKLETISVHRAELAAFRAALAQQGGQ